MPDFTFFWHDYETWGADPRRDRAAQFAGVRTDADFNIVDDPVTVFCAPADDMLPAPEACLITGLTPQHVREAGVPEAEFFAQIHAELARPGTCGAGYNSLRFDDEVTRFGLYRNFFDPYAREWQHGNSRWDIIDMVRLMRALRPQGMEWPERDDGAPSFRLEELTAANGIEHAGAHEALADVYATIAVARLVREHQPRLYEFVFRHRGKREAATLLNWRQQTVMLHVSRRIPAELGCISPVVPLAPHPRNRNSVVCYDLRHDPEPVVALSPDALRERLYTPRSELGENEERVGLKEIHLNKCPVICPVGTLTGEAAQKWQLDMDEAAARRERLAAVDGLSGKLAAVYGDGGFPPETDPDLALYDGFPTDDDRRRAEKVRRQSPADLATLRPVFDDPRLTELFFRYRARNWPQTLDTDERARWADYRFRRLVDGEGGAMTLAGFCDSIRRLRESQPEGPVAALLDALDAWPAEIGLE